MNRWGRARLALCLLLAVAAAGCTSFTAVNRQTLVFALGYDVGTAPHSKMLTMQFPNPEPGGMGGGGGGAARTPPPTFEDVSAEDDSTTLALTHLQAKAFHDLHLAQLQLIVLGSAQAKSGVLPDMLALQDDATVPETATLAVTDATARAFLNAGEQHEVGLLLPEFLNHRQHSPLAVRPEAIWRFVAETMGPGNAALAPMVKPDANAGFALQGEALFLQGRMVGGLNGPETAALAWLIGHGFTGNLTVQNGRSPTAVSLLSEKSRIIVRTPSAPVTVRLDVTAQLTESSRLNVQDDGAMLDTLVADKVRQEVRGMLEVLQSDGTDVLDVGERFRERGYTIGPGWPQQFAHLRFNLDVTAKVVSYSKR